MPNGSPRGSDRSHYSFVEEDSDTETSPAAATPGMTSKASPPVPPPKAARSRCTCVAGKRRKFHREHGLGGGSCRKRIQSQGIHPAPVQALLEAGLAGRDADASALELDVFDMAAPRSRPPLGIRGPQGRAAEGRPRATMAARAGGRGGGSSKAVSQAKAFRCSARGKRATKDTTT